jgi:hypothetical protein
MKDFSNASFPPDTIKAMTMAMRSALSTLPHPRAIGSAEWHFWTAERYASERIGLLKGEHNAKKQPRADHTARRRGYVLWCLTR